MNFAAFSSRWRWKNDRYLFVESLGSGTFGSVAKAYDLVQQRFVAIKQIKYQRNSTDIYPTTLQEIALLKEIHHPNIISFSDVSFFHHSQLLSSRLSLIRQVSQCPLLPNYLI